MYEYSDANLKFDNQHPRITRDLPQLLKSKGHNNVDLLEVVAENEDL